MRHSPSRELGAPVWQTVGQDRAVAALQRGLTQGRRAHAYLFVGPPHVGKGTLALELAQALNCDGPEPPCQECSSCRRIAAGIHADVQVVRVEAGDGGVHKDIRIQQIRDVERAVTQVCPLVCVFLVGYEPISHEKQAVIQRHGALHLHTREQPVRLCRGDLGPGTELVKGEFAGGVKVRIFNRNKFVLSV